jgi:hypothetical protein
MVSKYGIVDPGYARLLHPRNVSKATSSTKVATEQRGTQARL